MGVKLLTSYVKHNAAAILREEEWTPQKKGPAVVVDGPAAVYHCYKVQTQLEPGYGGQMDDFVVSARKFLKSLLSCCEKVTMVCEGEPTDSARMALLLARGRETMRQMGQAHGRFTGIPAFANRTMYQIAMSLDIELVQSDGDFDGVAASLANQRNCLVVSSDSDLFIFNTKGYIDTNTLVVTHATNKREAHIHATIYEAPRLAQHLKLDVSQLSVWATLLGNDFTSHESLAHFHTAIMPSSGKLLFCVSMYNYDG